MKTTWDLVKIILVSSTLYTGQQNSHEFNIGSGEDNSGGMSSASREDDSDEYNNF